MTVVSQPLRPALGMNAYPGPALDYKTQALFLRPPFTVIFEEAPGGPTSESDLIFRLPWPLGGPVTYQHNGKQHSEQWDRHAGATAEETDCTMLFVDGGFPVDVIFDSGVWGGRKKKERKQGEQANRDASHSNFLISTHQPPRMRISRKNLGPHK